jgi:DNA-binding MarR family transcriptional regulator
MEDKGLIYREANPNDGRGVLLFLTDFGKEKRELSRKTVLKFNEIIKNNIDALKLKHFEEVSEMINELIQNKNIFSPNTDSSN